jgi:arabinoxylan arabinofuranohydrolase
MRMKLFLQTLFLTLCCQMSAQDLSQSYKDIKNGNPISPCVFCADPTALVYDGRVYVYGSNDHQQFVANGKTGDNNYGAIKSLVVFSSDDMVNWTFHGTIDVNRICSSWGWRFANSWAPSATWREKEDGTKEFFLYFSNSGGSVGVLKASSPVGPWKSPLSKPLIDGDTPGVRPCTWVFDPGVVIDDNGTGWITFGGGDPNAQGNTVLPGNCRIAKLKDSMIEIDGDVHQIDVPNFTEAPWMHKYNGRYYLTYASEWPEKIAYAVADHIGGPYTPMGIISEIAGNSNTTHPAIVSFKDQWLFFSHNGGLPDGTSYSRSIIAEPMSYDKDGKINVIPPTAQGAIDAFSQKKMP